jgi:hypothetical protein
VWITSWPFTARRPEEAQAAGLLVLDDEDPDEDDVEFEDEEEDEEEEDESELDLAALSPEEFEDVPAFSATFSLSPPLPSPALAPSRLSVR